MKILSRGLLPSILYLNTCDRSDYQWECKILLIDIWPGSKYITWPTQPKPGMSARNWPSASVQCTTSTSPPVCCTGTYLGFWWKESPAEAVHVAHVHLDAGVSETQLMKAGGLIPWTDVTFARERRYGDGVLQLWLRQVITDPTVYITLNTHRQLPIYLE